MIDTRVPAWRGRLTAVSALGLLLALTGCSSSDDSGTSSSTTAATAAPSTGAATTSAAGKSTGAGTGATSRIVIKNFKFTPAKLTVAAGAKITVVNQDSTAHTVTATGAGKFNTGNIAPSATTSFTAPNAAGTYPYICNIHQFMKGTLTVR